ncbi:helix-turn-helix domain-containing protein [Paraliobacillus ryukyuensis]|uniref:helix-turn-helix domain-containing protein n=1 Tax=Paraliobacillus ryukyuensis TaxID=200904 RepID=UPI0009A8B9D5|nr:helix-turn-helix transcriptional regulator [Paraliobacillus ryukyuensis]
MNIEKGIFGRRLKQLRNSKGKSQEEVAVAVNISRARYSHYENNYVEPDIELIRKLADFFEVDTDYLIGRTEEARDTALTKPNRAFLNFEDITDQEKDYLEEQLRIFRKLKNQ